MPDKLVLVEHAEDPVAHVRLNRPAKKNAMTLEMMDALVEAGRGLMQRPGLRAVILSGAGGDFCAGLDTGALMGMATQIHALKAQMLNPAPGELANRFQLPCTIWSALRVPVIAALDGVCFGAGAQLALGADFRIMAPGGRFSVMEAKWGLIPDMGITQSLPALVSADRAKELILTARVLDAAEAQEAGLVTRLADNPYMAARELADEIAARSPDAVAAGKQLVDAVWGRDTAGLRLEAELQAALIGAPNQVEAVMANMQRRAPVWK
ncbi:crotonase/enoyl-CoA hydratase family protein [Maritimibacter sp. 55A14]|uniref:crotonase/enoyl-CoA hydratase family protein n=1 Tax=Maritimibacter sp. 55A14 TaxID=2174844 RepID=UPI000D6175F5|nr:crotonase/enoyl-CoA hydratase family protein [Maritimibacter sp. 55A14]PWE31301.1 crotonase/enoyl-CoA hydratase family protein [Maritimibacter sp. 55A14]